MERKDFTFNGWDCWFHPQNGWEAILSRKGEQPIIIHAASEKELKEKIENE